MLEQIVEAVFDSFSIEEISLYVDYIENGNDSNEAYAIDDFIVDMSGLDSDVIEVASLITDRFKETKISNRLSSKKSNAMNRRRFRNERAGITAMNNRKAKRYSCNKKQAGMLGGDDFDTWLMNIDMNNVDLEEVTDAIAEYAGEDQVRSWAVGDWDDDKYPELVDEALDSVMNVFKYSSVPGLVKMS